MAKIDELEERIEYVENTKKSEITEIFDRTYSAEVYSSGYVTDIEVDVISTAKARVTVSFGNLQRVFEQNLVVTSFKSERMNSVSITVTEGGEILSSRVRIKGIGVKLLT